MLERRHAWPEGHWDWLHHLSYKHGLRCGDMLFVGGQVDKDSKGRVLNKNDLKGQTRTAMRHIDTVLKELGSGLADVVKLVAFYVNSGGVDERAFLEDVCAALSARPGPAITAVPLPWLAYPGMMVEIEAVAMRGSGGAGLARTASVPSGQWPIVAPFSHGVRAGEMIYASAQVARDSSGRVLHPGDIVRQTELVMENLAKVLAGFGATLDDSVKFNIYYRGDGTKEDWRRAAVVRARYFKEPGPCATGIALPWLPEGEMTRLEVWAMLGKDGKRLPREHVSPEGHWDWLVPLPYKHGLKCSNMVFVTGQVAFDNKGNLLHPGDLVGQTRATMANVRRVLEGFGLTMDHTVKSNAFYMGEAGPTTIVENQLIRSACFTEPGPTSTGVPVKYLAVEGLLIEVEAVAMV